MRSTSAASLLKEITSRSECPACVVITCPDRVRRDRAITFLLNHFAKGAPKPTSFTFSEQGRTSPTSLLRDLSEPSLFDPVRFGLIRGIESARAADVEPISEFLQRRVLGTHLVIVGASLPNTPNFKKFLEKNATIINFEPLKGAELNRWTERELKHSGIQEVDDAVVELLISLAGEEPETVGRLVEKFALYLGDSPATTQALRSLEPGRSSASDFELAETMLGKNRATTEALLLQLISRGSSPFMLIGLLTKTFTTILRIRALSDKGVSQGDIKADLAISPWLFSKYLPLARKISTGTLLRALSALAEADFRLKDKSLGPAAVFSSVASRIG
jgi:DNA polymerase III delta subunit